MRILKLLLLILIFETINLSAQLISVGEQLEYDVKYLGIKIAHITITTEKIELYEGKPVIKTKADVYTYDHIPYFKVRTNMTSRFSKSDMTSYEYERNYMMKNGKWEYQKIEFNYDNPGIWNRKWVDNKLMQSSKYKMSKGSTIHDAIAIFFYSRFSAAPNKHFNFNAYLDDDPFKININYKNIESKSIDAVDYPVRTLFLTGNANWQGGYGLSGNFEGWMTDDAAKIPILGKVDFIIGKISIELVKWKRAGWNPPRGK